MSLTASLNAFAFAVSGWLTGPVSLKLDKGFGPYSGSYSLRDITTDIATPGGIVGCYSPLPLSGVITLPRTAPSTAEWQTDGSILAEVTQTIADFDIDFAGLAETPVPLSCDTGSDLGLYHLAYTSLSLKGKHTATATQHVRFVPSFRLRYTFSRPVVLNGATLSVVEVDAGSTVSVAIADGADTNISITPTVLLNGKFESLYAVGGTYGSEGEAGTLSVTTPAFSLGPSSRMQIFRDIVYDLVDECLDWGWVTEWGVCTKWGIPYPCNKQVEKCLKHATGIYIQWYGTMYTWYMGQQKFTVGPVLRVSEPVAQVEEARVTGSSPLSGEYVITLAPVEIAK
jgi:hypothetical protein